MTKAKLLFACVSMLFIAAQIKGQSLALILTNENTQKEYTIESHDKILLDIKNKRGKLKEKEEVVVLSVDEENLYVSPDKKRFGEQAIKIDEIKQIWIKTPGTRATGCLLFGMNLFSKTSNVPHVYKKINLEKRNWKVTVAAKMR